VGPLAGRVAVVSGGGKGIGRSVCLDLAARGSAVVVNNRNRTVDADGRGPADHVVDEIVSAGGQAVADYGDAADPDSGRAMVARALESFGRLDICVPNAGIKGTGMFHKSGDAQLAGVVTTNLLGAAALARAAVGVMRTAGYGRIVFVGSTAGLHGLIGESSYAASKGAMIALARSLAGEGASKGVTTNLIMPYAATQMNADDMAASGYTDTFTTDSVAPVVSALADERCRLNGELLIVAGDLLRRASAVEWSIVHLPGDGLDPAGLEGLVAQSRQGGWTEYPEALSAFMDLAAHAAADRSEAR